MTHPVPPGPGDAPGSPIAAPSAGDALNTTTCRQCGATGSGKFCSGCGAPLAGATCPACRAPLTPGAKFCHRCGTPAGLGEAASATPRAETRGFERALPWSVAAIALVALIALVAGQRFGGRTPNDAAANPDAGTAPAAMGIGGAGQQFPRARTDIASMTPEEAAGRLFNRVMTYAENNQLDSAQLFSPMAIAAYQRIENPTPDQRYDLGRIAAVTGNDEIATAEADTILASNPNHLLGLILAAEAARMRNDQAKARAYTKRFVAAVPTEKRKNLPEYQQHANDITATLEEANKPGT